MINKIADILVYIVFILLIYVLVLSHYPYKTVVFNKPATVITKEIEAGGILKYKLDLCKYTDAPTTISKVFVDGFYVSLVPTTSSAKKGCVKLVIPVRVPEFLPSGYYYLQLSLTNKVNFLREITVHYNTDRFLIKEAK